MPLKSIKKNGRSQDINVKRGQFRTCNLVNVTLTFIVTTIEITKLALGPVSTNPAKPAVYKLQGNSTKLVPIGFDDAIDS